MLLRHSHTSPYVRKVMVMLHEIGLADRVNAETVDGWAEPDYLTAENPLSMVPTLVTEEGVTLYDSPVICEYLDYQHTGTKMIPAEGESRWQVLREQALADGVLDSAILIFMETMKRPEEKRWDWWIDLKRRAISRTLDLFENNIHEVTGRIDLGTLSLAVALGYLDLRGAVGKWRDTRPALSEWYAGMEQRPSMLATVPPA